MKILTLILVAHVLSEVKKTKIYTRVGEHQLTLSKPGLRLTSLTSLKEFERQNMPATLSTVAQIVTWIRLLTANNVTATSSSHWFIGQAFA